MGDTLADRYEIHLSTIVKSPEIRITRVKQIQPSPTEIIGNLKIPYIYIHIYIFYSELIAISKQRTYNTIHKHYIYFIEN